MDTTEVLRQLAIIVLAAKFFGLLARKIKAPMVVGEIIAGLIIGPSMLGLLQSSDFLQGMAEIGVIMLMFSAGLNTDIRQLKATGVKSTVIACAGVFVPLILGTILYMCFYGFSAPGSEHFLKAVFIGTILTATSVSITVQTLKEMGKLSDAIGTTIMSAAIIDDVIGIIVLTVVIGFRDPEAKILDVALARESAAVLDSHCVMPEIAVQETEGIGRFEDYARIAVEDDERGPPRTGTRASTGERGRSSGD